MNRQRFTKRFTKRNRIPPVNPTRHAIIGPANPLSPVPSMPEHARETNVQRTSRATTVPAALARASRVARSRLALLGLLIACLLCLPGLGCALHAQGSTMQNGHTGPTDPAHWIGRWKGSGSRTLRIMPDQNDGYRLTIRDGQGIRTHYRATADRQELLFERDGKVLSIKPGIGRDTGEAGLASLSNCLIVSPGGHGYCRRPGSVDALPLAHGAFVSVKTRCRNAQPNGILYFNGRGLLRPDQRACRASIISQQGIVFHLRDSCAAGYISNGQQPNETASVPDRHDLALQTVDGSTRLYRYCAAGLLPPDLQSANGAP